MRSLWNRLFGYHELQEVECLIQRVIRNQEKLMTVLADLKNAVADIAADASAAHDEVLAAVDHIMKNVPDPSPELQAAVDSLHASHAAFTDSLKTLKDKVDSVVASGGPAG